MKLVVLVTIAAGLALSGCDRADRQSEARVDRLEKRLKAVELQANATQATVDSLEGRVSAPAPVPSFELENAPGGSHRYESKERCEEARQALLQSRAQQEESDRARGVIRGDSGTPVCLPI